MNIYDTVVGGQHRLIAKRVHDYFEEQLIMRSERILQQNSFVYKVAPDVESVPQWNHPVIFRGRKGEHFAAVDTRNFEKPDGRVTNARELPNIYERAKLAVMWEKDRTAFKPIMATLAVVYAEWMVSAIRSKYGPSEAEIETMRLYFITYYWCTSITDSEWETITVEDIKERIFRLMVRELRRPTGFVDGLMNDTDYTSLIQYFVDQSRPRLDATMERMTSHLDNVAIRLDTGALLMLVIRSSWMGFAAQDIVGVGIEYPPYLIYMVNQALSLGIYRRTKIGGAVESAKRQRIPVANIASWVKEVSDEVQ